MQPVIRESDRAPFLAAILEDPEDKVARGIYADWLEEQGVDVRALRMLGYLFQDAMQGKIGWACHMPPSEFVIRYNSHAWAVYLGRIASRPPFRCGLPVVNQSLRSDSKPGDPCDRLASRYVVSMKVWLCQECYRRMVQSI